MPGKINTRRHRKQALGVCRCSLCCCCRRRRRGRTRKRSCSCDRQSCSLRQSCWGRCPCSRAHQVRDSRTQDAVHALFPMHVASTLYRILLLVACVHARQIAHDVYWRTALQSEPCCSRCGRSLTKVRNEVLRCALCMHAIVFKRFGVGLLLQVVTSMAAAPAAAAVRANHGHCRSLRPSTKMVTASRSAAPEPALHQVWQMAARMRLDRGASPTWPPTFGKCGRPQLALRAGRQEQHQSPPQPPPQQQQPRRRRPPPPLPQPPLQSQPKRRVDGRECSRGRRGGREPWSGGAQHPAQSTGAAAAPRQDASAGRQSRGLEEGSGGRRSPSHHGRSHSQQRDASAGRRSSGLEEGSVFRDGSGGRRSPSHHGRSHSQQQDASAGRRSRGLEEGGDGYCPGSSAEFSPSRRQRPLRPSGGRGAAPLPEGQGQG